MKEILRKHGKIIMGIVSIALMFVFTLPTFRQPSDRDRHSMVIGTVNGVKVTNDDMVAANNELALLEPIFKYALSLQQSEDFREYFNVWRVLEKMPSENDRALYWFLLKQDAKKYGASVFSENDAASFISAWQLQPYIDSHVTSRTMAGVFSNLDTIRNYLKFLSTPPRPVSALELMADKALRKLQVAYVTLDGQTGWEQAAEPTAAQLEAQFNGYKGVIRTPMLAGTAPGVLPPADKEGHHFPFGYKYPDRVVVDYVAFDRGEIRTRIKAAMAKALEDARKGLEAARLPVMERLKGMPEYGAAVKKQSDARAALQSATGSNAAADVIALRTKEVGEANDAVSKLEFGLLTKTPAYVQAQDTLIEAMQPEQAAYNYYDSHRDRYKKPASALEVASTQSTQPALLTWEEVKEKVIDAQVVEPKVSRQMKLMTDLFFDKASKTKDADYGALAKELAKTSEYNGYEPKVGTTGPKLLGAGQLAGLPGIGGAFYLMEATGDEIPLGEVDPAKPSLAVSVEELVTLEKTSPMVALKLKAGTEGPLLTDRLKNSYVYRVSRTEKSHEPASVNEEGIRPQVVEDFKKLETFKKRQQQMKELAKAANGGDLEALAGQQKLPLGKPAEFTQLTMPSIQRFARDSGEFEKNLSKASPEVLEAFSAQIDEQKKSISDEKTRLNFDQLKEIMTIRGFVDASFALANRAGSSAQVSKVATELEDESTLKCYVVQLLKTSPATGADFGSGRFSFFRTPQEDVGLIDPQFGVTGKFLTSYLKQEALEARVKWKKK